MTQWLCVFPSNSLWRLIESIMKSRSRTNYRILLLMNRSVMISWFISKLVLSSSFLSEKARKQHETMKNSFIAIMSLFLSPATSSRSSRWAGLYHYLAISYAFTIRWSLISNYALICSVPFVMNWSLTVTH